MTRAPKLHLERFLPYRLSVLSNTVSSAIAAAYFMNFGLSIPEWRVMAVLAANPGLSAAEVTARTAMDKVAVSRALARLTAAGRVSRATHGGDKRRSVLRLAAKGWKIHDTDAPRARAHEREMLGLLTAEERRVLAQILDKLAPIE